MLEVKQEMSFEDLKNNCWSGAVYTLEAIEKAELEDAFMDYLEQIFCDETPTMTEINDVLWFDDYINNDFINEHKTLDDIDSLEELKEYAKDEEKEVIDTAIETNHDKDLWEYILNNYYLDDNLSNIFEEISSLEPKDYISFDNIKSLTEFIELTKDNDTVMEVINAIKEANLIDEYWNRLEEECKGIGYTVTNVVDDIESLDVNELIESL